MSYATVFFWCVFASPFILAGLKLIQEAIFGMIPATRRKYKYHSSFIENIMWLWVGAFCISLGFLLLPF